MFVRSFHQKRFYSIACPFVIFCFSTSTSLFRAMFLVLCCYFIFRHYSACHIYLNIFFSYFFNGFVGSHFRFSLVWIINMETSQSLRLTKFLSKIPISISIVRWIWTEAAICGYDMTNGKTVGPGYNPWHTQKTAPFIEMRLKSAAPTQTF